MPCPGLVFLPLDEEQSSGVASSPQRYSSNDGDAKKGFASLVGHLRPVV